MPISFQPPRRPHARAAGRPNPLPAFLAAALLAAAALPGAAPVARGSENEYAKIIVHLVPYTGGSMNCRTTKGQVGCDKMLVAGTLNQPYYGFLCVVDGDPAKGIAGLQFGVEYNAAGHRGVDVSDWTLCGALQFTMDPFPKSGSGNQITWDPTNNCQRAEPGGAGKGVVAVAGYFYMTAYSADTFKVTRRPVDNLASIADCNSAEYVVDGFGTNFNTSHLGFVSFSEGATVPGYNPCGDARPTVKLGWGEMKANEGKGR